MTIGDKLDETAAVDELAEDLDIESYRSPEERIAEETDAIIKDIEAGSVYALRTSNSPEDLDPNELEDAVADSTGVMTGSEVDQIVLGAHSKVSANDPVVPEEMDSVLEADVRAQEEQRNAEEGARTQRRLRGVLAFVIIILLILAGVIGVFIWRNSMSPDVKPADTEALITSSAGTNTVTFEKVDAELIPNFTELFGMTLDEAKEAAGEHLQITAGLEESSNENVSSMKFITSGVLKNDSDEQFAQVILGFNKKKKIVYVRCAYDMDDMGVAVADFSELVSDDTVARSVLRAMGVDKKTVKAAQLKADPSSDAVTTSDTAQKAEFKGTIDSKEAPKNYTLTETYDRAIGSSVGDNSVLRTLTVELF